MKPNAISLKSNNVGLYSPTYRALIMFVTLYFLLAVTLPSTSDEFLSRAQLPLPEERFSVQGVAQDMIPELEGELLSLDTVIASNQGEPQLYYVRGRLHSVRLTMLRNYRYAGLSREEWFETKSAIDALQAVRDNYTEAIRLHEAGSGRPLEVHMLNIMRSSPVISLDVDERISKAIIAKLEDPKEPFDVGNEDPMTKTDFIVDMYTVIIENYAGDGYFEDAGRVLAELKERYPQANDKVAEVAARVEKQRSTFDPNNENVLHELRFRKSGSVPKPLSTLTYESANIPKKDAAVSSAMSKQPTPSTAVQPRNKVAETARPIAPVWLLVVALFVVALIGIFLVKRRKKFKKSE